MNVALPNKMPQTTCGNICCNNKLEVPNEIPMTSQLCSVCAKKYGFRHEDKTNGIMPFEEEFPSCADLVNDEKWTDNVDIEVDYVKHLMSKHCLDKQRVREVILKLTTRKDEFGIDKIGEQLIKELGL